MVGEGEVEFRFCLKTFPTGRATVLYNKAFSLSVIYGRTEVEKHLQVDESIYFCRCLKSSGY